MGRMRFASDDGTHKLAARHADWPGAFDLPGDHGDGGVCAAILHRRKRRGGLTGDRTLDRSVCPPSSASGSATNKRLSAIGSFTPSAPAIARICLPKEARSC
jgi:hypothetical protein